jgi:hypothetical protein
MAHPRDGWQGQNCSKNGMHNLGGTVKEHSAAKFANGGSVRRFADGDSVMFGDAPINDMGPPASAMGASTAPGTSSSSPGDSEQAMASQTATTSVSPSAGLSDADVKGGSSVDVGADSSNTAAAKAGAAAAVADAAKAKKRRDSMQVQAADIGGYGGMMRGKQAVEANRAAKAENDKMEATQRASKAGDSDAVSRSPAGRAAAAGVKSGSDTLFGQMYDKGRGKKDSDAPETPAPKKKSDNNVNSIPKSQQFGAMGDEGYFSRKKT